MANDWAPDGVVLDQTGETTGDAVPAARVRLSIGPSADESDACGDARRAHLCGLPSGPRPRISRRLLRD